MLASIYTWIEEKRGVPLSAAGVDPVPVIAVEEQLLDTSPLGAVRVGNKAIVTARASWVERLRQVVESLHPDLLFSTFGASELARVTLPYGFGVWGPAWLLFADEASWRPIEDDRPVQLNRPELAGVDYDIFWHCEADGPLAGFGIFEDGRLVALATVRDDGDPVWEIGMDVAPDSKGRGLGRAVVNAAGRWILENGRLILATTAPFNVPSTRTLRSLGLRYLLSEMKGREGLFQVPPQPLGSPYPGAKVYDYYPRWAMNQGIQPRPGS